MPGVRSLQAGEYYAHPRNLFWEILETLGLITPGLEYGERTTAVAAAGIALWDVLQRCERTGSLDSSIVESSETSNNLVGFLEAHPTVRVIAFNGAKAERAFRQHVLPTLPNVIRRRIELHRLPSTSPAFAIPKEKKIEAWRTLLIHLELSTP